MLEASTYIKPSQTDVPCQKFVLNKNLHASVTRISWISSDFGSELSATHASLFQWLILKSERGVPSIISEEQLQFFHASHARLHAQSH